MREITNDSRFKNAVLACTKESDLKPEPVCLKRALEGIDRLRQRIPRPIIIAIAGASGSGKTTVASAFQQALGGQSAVLHQDDYYRGKTRLKEMFGTDYQPNWDHPIALDLPRLSADLSALQDEQAVQSRRYDMVASEPSDDISTINPRQTPIIILEGIYALHETIRGWVDFGIYVDVPLATRLGRRILRDAKQGGTFDPEANLRYILEVAEPTHARYAQDQKANASRIVSGLEAPL